MEPILKIAIGLVFLLITLVVIYSPHERKGSSRDVVPPSNAKVVGLLPPVGNPFTLVRLHETKDQFKQPRAIASEHLWTSTALELLPIGLFNPDKKSSSKTNSPLTMREVNLIPLPGRHKGDLSGMYSATYRVVNSDSPAVLTYFYHCASDRDGNVRMHLPYHMVPSANPIMNELRILDYLLRASANGVFANFLIYYSDPFNVNSREGQTETIKTKISSTTRILNGCPTRPFIQYYLTTYYGIPLAAWPRIADSQGLRFFDGLRIGMIDAVRIGVKLINLVESLHTEYGIVHGGINVHTVLMKRDRELWLSNWGKSRLVYDNISNVPIMSSPKKSRKAIKRSISYWANLAFGDLGRRYSITHSNIDHCDAYTSGDSVLRTFRDDLFAIVMTIAVMIHGPELSSNIESICISGVNRLPDQGLLQQYSKIKLELNPFDILLNLPDNTNRHYSLDANLRKNKIGGGSREPIQRAFWEIMRIVRDKDEIPKYALVVEQLEGILKLL